MSFLDNYEDVNSRIKRFRETYPDNRIITEVVNFQPENGWILVRCDIFVNGELKASDYAFGDKLTYPNNMQKWYVEDTVTSSCGRAIALIMDVNHKATKQNMARVERYKEIAPKPDTKEPAVQVADEWENFVTEKPAPKPMDVNAIAAAMGGEIVAEIPLCENHGREMKFREGTKNGKAYHGYVCALPQHSQEPKCPPKWYDLMPSGKWVFNPKKG